jgi:5'-nucleotidase/UDP-sugar diphosphatase
MRRTFTIAATLGAVFAFSQEPIAITVLHTNDLHARVEPTVIRGKQFGGYARQATLIKQLRSKHKNTVLLNAGDTFQGTLFFNVYEGLADAALMNMIGYDAMAVGNHEFDKGPAPLAAFTRSVRFPVLAANVDFGKEPLLTGLIKPYTVLDVGGQKLGVVGGVTEYTPSISSPGENILFLDPVKPLQAAVDELTRQGVNKIVLVTHIGYEDEIELVKRMRNVDALIGGHTHSLLGSPQPLEGWPQPRGAYPTEVLDADGRTVHVVQAWEWGKVVGSLTLQFDAEGRVVGVPSAVVTPVDESIAPDPAVSSIVSAFYKPIEALAKAVVGQADDNFPRRGPDGEDNALDRLIADAMLAATKKTGAVAAFMNSGGVRASLESGPITFGELKEIQPFDNTLVVLDLSGEELLKSIEHGAGAGGLLLPSEGTTYTIDPKALRGKRVSDVVIAGSPIDLRKTYRIVTNSFLAAGGDAHEAMKGAKGFRIDTGILDSDSFVDYVRSRSPLRASGDARIRYVR